MLRLWKVSASVSNLKTSEVPDPPADEVLGPTATLSDIFEESLAPNRLHVLVNFSESKRIIFFQSLMLRFLPLAIFPSLLLPAISPTTLDSILLSTTSHRGVCICTSLHSMESRCDP
jgi:hypothetical protein